MKNKFFIFALLCAFVLTSCEPDGIGDASLIEGGWDLSTADYDKTVSSDLTGSTYLKDSAYTRVYDEKESVWLFYQGNISEWVYFMYNGEGFWSGYSCDCYRNYTTEGEGASLTIVETGGSIIPGMEDATYTKRYKVEKLTSRSMVLSCTERMYVSDLQSSVDVHVVYTFKRENTLLEYIHSVYPN